MPINQEVCCRLTGCFRDKFTVEKGERLLYLSLFPCFTDTTHSCLLFFFLGGGVKAEKSHTLIKIHHLNVTAFHDLQIGEFFVMVGAENNEL